MTKKEIQETIVRNLNEANILNYEKVAAACLSLLNVSGLETTDKFEYGWLKERIENWTKNYEIIKEHYDKLTSEVDMIHE